MTVGALLGGWQFCTRRPMTAGLRGKNPVGRVGVKSHAIIGADEGDVDGKSREYRLKLDGRKRSRLCDERRNVRFGPGAKKTRPGWT